MSEAQMQINVFEIIGRLYVEIEALRLELASRPSKAEGEEQANGPVVEREGP
jgi:hypothetical protein